MSLRVRVGLLCLVVGAAAAMPAGSAIAASPSLYSGPGPRPGPDILYRKLASAPQLRNAGIWHARPILISGSSAYRKGEFLYQDFLYDDHGAKAGSRDSGDPRTANDSFSAPNGTYTYPTRRFYADNAADLVELRIKPLAGATAFRITLNTLHRPRRVATTIAIGGSSEPMQFPHGANAAAPARLFLTVHGRHADLTQASDGAPLTPAPRVSVNKRRRQIQVIVPHDAWNPGRRTVRFAAGVGLWDPSANQYLIPGSSADDTHPGGAFGLSNPTAFFNAAFRYREPFQHVFPFDTVFSDPAWWRDRQQGNVLAAGSLAPFHARVSFAKLRAGANDEMHGKRIGVPRRGPMDRILVSHFETKQGADFSKSCGSANDCQGELLGRLQPYAIYVPRKPMPSQGYGLTLLMHSLGAGYNQFSDNRNQSQLGERGPGSIVITPEGRGPDGWYWGHAGADTFEVWADAARHYRLDPRWTAVSGYSMGGYGTYKFATQYPDLFARANPVVGPPGLGVWAPPSPPVPGGDASQTNRMLASLRNIPFLIWDGSVDELVPVSGPVAQTQTFDDLGYRYIFDLFTTSDHFQLAVNDQYAPAAHFLGQHKVNRNPPHVSYAVNPKMDFANVGTVADHAYWLSGLRLRDPSGDSPLGLVDARSDAFGVGDPVPAATQFTGGTLDGGNEGSMPYAERSKAWGTASNATAHDRLHLTATNLSQVVVHASRARLSCHPALDVTTDGPLTVRLAGCGRTLTY